MTSLRPIFGVLGDDYPVSLHELFSDRPIFNWHEGDDLGAQTERKGIFCEEHS